jgi:predicted dehydrogenase
VVVGAGWAGEGHTLALRHAGVDVVAICARRPEAARALAARLGVAASSGDWRAALDAHQPDIVALATPGGLRGEVIAVAARSGCHVYSDKPLATSAPEAERSYRVMEDAGLKHAFAATSGLEPSVVWLAELVRGGAIGTLREIEWIARAGPPNPLRPWSWNDSVAEGGGLLHGGLPHCLAALQTITGGTPVRVAGMARASRDRAPVVPTDPEAAPGVRVPPPSAEDAARLAWRACDADHAAWCLFEFSTSLPGAPGASIPVSLTLGGAVRQSWPPSGLRLYGDAGTLIAEGGLYFRVFRLRAPDAEREALLVPQRLLDALPPVSDKVSPAFGAVENKWAALAREFVADIRGEPRQPYLTFRDGWRHQEAIDAVRAGAGWHTLPA